MNQSKLTLKKYFAIPRTLTMFNGFKNQKLVEELCQHCSYAERFNNA